MTDSTRKFWTEQLANRERAVIINGTHYRIGSTPYPQTGYGFGGDEFRIKMHTGEEIRTKDLWHQGEVPEEFKQLLPDNASWIRTIKVIQYRECSNCHNLMNRDNCYKTTCYNAPTINEERIEVK